MTGKFYPDAMIRRSFFHEEDFLIIHLPETIHFMPYLQVFRIEDLNMPEHVSEIYGLNPRNPMRSVLDISFFTSLSNTCTGMCAILFRSMTLNFV